MHDPAAVDAAPSPEKRGEYAHMASRPLCGCNGTGTLEREICAGYCTGGVQTASLGTTEQTIFECTAALNSMKDGPVGWVWLR